MKGFKFFNNQKNRDGNSHKNCYYDSELAVTAEGDPENPVYLNVLIELDGISANARDVGQSVSRSVTSNSATSWTVARQAPLSMEFSRQEHWSELPFPSPRDLPDSGIEPVSPAGFALQADSLPLSHMNEGDAQ